MAAFLLDTNAIGDFVAGQRRVLTKAAQYSGQIAAPSIVYGEVLYGLARLPAGRRRNDLAAKTAAAFALIPCIDVTKSIATAYGNIRNAAESAGITLDDNDLWIAAAAIDHQAVLVTRDADFKHIPSLNVEDWTV